MKRGLKRILLKQIDDSGGGRPWPVAIHNSRSARVRMLRQTTDGRPILSSDRSGPVFAGHCAYDPSEHLRSL